MRSAPRCSPPKRDVRIAVTLPQFREDPGPALAAARAAERERLDGVFVFDHLWPIGQPGRPALAAFPLLGALAAVTDRLMIGTLVARVGLVPDALLVHQFESLHRMVEGRLIAGLGTGDHLSRAENEAYRIPYPTATERREQLANCCRGLRERGITTWVGGGSQPTREVAVAEADALNLWDAPAELVAAETRIPVTWGGMVPDSVEHTTSILRAQRAAGATWAVCAPPYGTAVDPEPAVKLIAEAARAVASDAV